MKRYFYIFAKLLYFTLVNIIATSGENFNLSKCNLYKIILFSKDMEFFIYPMEKFSQENLKKIIYKVTDLFTLMTGK